VNDNDRSNHLSFLQLEMVFVVPPIASLLAKSPEVDNYQLKYLKEIHCGASSLSSNVEDLLRKRFPGLTLRQSRFTVMYNSLHRKSNAFIAAIVVLESCQSQAWMKDEDHRL